MAKYLFVHLRALEGMLKNKQVSLFVDYDGTLTPIVKSPEKAVILPRMKKLLTTLKKCYPLAIISGRSLSDLKKRVGIRGIAYAGNHGMEIWSRDFRLEMEEAKKLKKKLSTVTEELTMLLSGVKGVLVENKGLTASVHYRLAGERHHKYISEVVNAALLPCILKNIFIVRGGKKILEIRPDIRWDKGWAVKWILGQQRFKGTLPVYVGDDETDRDAFRVLKGKGVSVGVGRRWKEVDYFLKTQNEVKRFLKWLSECENIKTC